MKVLEKERVVAPPERSGRGHVRVARAVAAPRPTAQPAVTLRTRVVPATRRRNAALAEFCNRVVAFSAIVGLTYVGSTLGGYVMLERARQASRHGVERATYARSQAKAARASIESLTNPSDLGAWGKAHGFVPGGAGVVVASR